MIQHLFNAKRIDNGEWVEGFVTISPVDGDLQKNKKNACIQYFYMDKVGQVFRDEFAVDPKTICRCTGLTDKNGVKIFEGDICRDSLGWEFEVIWDKENARFLGRQSIPRGDTYICYVGRIPAVEVIGNIHDKETNY